MTLVAIPGVESRSGIHRDSETLLQNSANNMLTWLPYDVRRANFADNPAGSYCLSLAPAGAVAELVVSLGDFRFYESVSILSARKRAWLDRQRYRRDYRLRPPQSNRCVVISFCSYFHRFIFLLPTSSYVFRTSFGATARAEPLPFVPMV
jgi:hypothetical protein